jgi:peptidyl-prolyl cis-trans isomerase D
VSVAVRAAPDEADPAGLTQEALRAYYEANAARYVDPAKVRLQYLLVDEEEIGRGLTPGEADLRALYEQAPDLFRDPATQQLRPFEEVREALADSWRARQARQRYGELREELGNAVFEAIDRLDPVAERFGLKIRETALVPLEEVEIAGVKSDQLIAALREAQAHGGQNLEPIELAPGKLAAVRVAEYVPPRALSFDEARARVIQDLARERGRERLRELAPQWLERLEKGEAVPELAWQPKRSLTRASSALPPELVDEIFKAAPPWPRYLHWQASNGDLWFVRIEASRQPQLQADDPMVQFAGERIRSVVGNVEWRGWLKTLEARHPVVIRREALQELTAAP